MADVKKLLKSFKDFHKNKGKEYNLKIWDKGNKVLYDLCKKYPEHKEEDEIFAKIWLIGRAYSVAIERRPIEKNKKKKSNDDFYKDVVKKIRKSEFDKKIKNIPIKGGRLAKKNIKIICDVHSYIIKILKPLTKQHNISFASKYLHFHRPLVPIYDSRAKKSIARIFRENRYLKECERKLNIKKSDSGKEYQSFVEKIFCLQSLLDEKCKKSTMRDIDKYLIWYRRQI